MIKAIVFDLGGVLFERTVPRTMIQVSKDHGLDNDEVKSFMDTYYVKVMQDKLDEDEFFEMLINRFNLPLKKEFFYDSFVKKAVPIEGTWGIVEKLKGKYTIGIISDLTRNWKEYKEKNYALSKNFNFITYSYECHATKPDHKIFKSFLKKSKLKAEECVFIDDKQENVEAAKILGFTSFVFEDPEQCESELRKYVAI